MQWVEDMDPDAPGVRRVNFVRVGELPPDMVRHIARLDDRRAADLQRRSRRTAVSPLRVRPRSHPPLFQSEDSISFPRHHACDINFELAHIRVYENGIAFDVRARSGTMPALPPSQRIYVGPRTRSKIVQGAYLGVVCPDGTVVTNKACLPSDAPQGSDTSSPWLHGSTGYSFDSGVGASYFLSPRPEPRATITVSLSYPEVGVDSALSLSLDSGTFTRASL
ncbi:hypothetical protein ABH922_000585 [Rhodococcus sp. 27YEA15]|uniref:hypothetical protein n=1 Tax=Rhodococcus sp. 27YEA15 TaxID=3156259 RepID=UPI003C7EBE7B